MRSPTRKPEMQPTQLCVNSRHGRRGQRGCSERDVGKMQSHFEAHQTTQVITKRVSGQDT